MLAAAGGNGLAVDALLAAGADIRCCSPTGRTALGDALARGHCHVAMQLWERAQQEPDCEAILAAALEAAKPLLDRPRRHVVTPLAIAAKQGYHQLVPLLVTPANLNLPQGPSRMTPLHLALKNNHMKAAAALLDAGAAVNVPDNIGRIPLAFAVQYSNTQLNVRLLQLMKQQHPAAAGETALMEPLITAAAWLSAKAKHAHGAARLFAAVMAAWGASKATDLLSGLLGRLGTTPHYLAEVMLVGWRQAQREQLVNHALLDRLQRLMLETPDSSSHQQQQGHQKQCLLSSQDRPLRLHLPLALLLNQAGQGKGQGPEIKASSNASLAANMAELSLGSNGSSADAIAAAARRGSMREVAALLAAVPSTQLPAALLAAAQAAGSWHHMYLSLVTLQQLAALDWQAAASTNEVAPLGAVVRAAAAAAATTGAAGASSAGGAISRPGARVPSSTQQQQQQQQGGPVSGAGFCLYRALLDSWQAVPQMVGRELAAQVVAAVEAATAQGEGGMSSPRLKTGAAAPFLMQ